VPQAAFSRAVNPACGTRGLTWSLYLLGLPVALLQINRLIQEAGGDNPPFPPTDIFNETWLLRVVLDWFSNHRQFAHKLTPVDGGSWFSEALLPSAFLARYRNDTLSESWTHADAVIGHFKIGAAGKADCSIKPDAKQFVVCEAKVFSKLSPGVRNAPYYDQAARNVACIGEVLRRGSVCPKQLESLAFLVLSPIEMIHAGAFSQELTRESVKRKVHQRVSEYASVSQDSWLNERFLPLLQRIEISLLSWEEAIAFICCQDAENGVAIKSFYDQVIRFNRPFGFVAEV